jgi:AraC-like DNA-binding protein
MDPMSKLLGGIRAEGSVVTRAVMEAPWTIRFTDRSPLTMVTVVCGGGVLVLADGSEVKLQARDTVVVRGPEPFLLADAPGSAGRPHTEYELACFASDEDGESCATDLGPWGEACDEATGLIVGAYRAAGRRHERLLRALPPALVISEDGEVCGWLEATAAETAARRAGSQALMDRLLDWGLVCTLRTWFEREGPDAPAWYRGYADPVVGPALEAVHERPGRRWTVASLAAEAGVSRALFAKRFSEIMGAPPLAYVTEWRMAEAEELLADPETTVATVARRIGYADAFGFSAAFKRRTGMSPTEYRTALR